MRTLLDRLLFALPSPPSRASLVRGGLYLLFGLLLYGLFLGTAHPAKFKGTVDRILNADIEIPAKLQAFMKGTKQSVELCKDFDAFKSYLMEQ